MENNEKQYVIKMKESSPYKNGRTRIISIPTTKEAFDEYYRPINAYRQRMFEHKACFCPKSEWLLCNMDCCNCFYRAEGDRPAVHTVIGKDGEELDIWETVADDSPSTEDSYCNDEKINALKQKIAELDEDAQAICETIMEGYTEREAAEKLGIPRNTYTYRRDKVLSSLKNFLENF